MENAGTARSSRWNPTKDQVTILEYLYKEGMQSPRADQIEQIAGRLRQYGHIEGKNVFYWFQNYKARLRQKEKQERIAYFNRLRHKTSRYFYPPPCSNVTGWVSPYHIQQVGDHHINQYGSHVMIPSGGGYEKPTITYHEKQLSDITPSAAVSMSSSLCRFDGFAYGDHCHNCEGINVNSNAEKTLPLFPLQPLHANGVENSSFAPDSDSPVVCFGDDGGREHRFIDFFSGGSTR